MPKSRELGARLIFCHQAFLAAGDGLLQMNKVRADIISLLFVFSAIAVAAILYPSLPEQIPTHWNAQGEVDGYMKKPGGVIIMPAMAVFTFVIMKLIPVISPKGFRIDKFSDVFGVLQVTLVGFMSIVAILVLLEARGLDVRINEMIIAGIGLLFVIIGNYLGRVRKNFFIGLCRANCRLLRTSAFSLSFRRLPSPPSYTRVYPSRSRHTGMPRVRSTAT